MTKTFAPLESRLYQSRTLTTSRPNGCSHFVLGSIITTITSLQSFVSQNIPRARITNVKLKMHTTTQEFRENRYTFVNCRRSYHKLELTSFIQRSSHIEQTVEMNFPNPSMFSIPHARMLRLNFSELIQFVNCDRIFVFSSETKNH